MKPSFIIAATSSGCGKTTFSLGLIRALCDNGMRVRPFKCGPDYIDTRFQSVAAGVESVNLDLFMASEEHVRDVYSYYSEGSDVCVVEGVMGMFDGYDKMKGSTAHLARVLDIPVVLLVNAASAAYSVAAMIYGFSNLIGDIKIAGVVFNRVASERHFSFLKSACEDVGVKCLGYLQKNDNLKTPSRHLGLTLQSKEEMDRFVNNAAEEVKRHIDIGSIIRSAKVNIRQNHLKIPRYNGITVAVARDEAFNFIYHENLEIFGDGVRFFSPLHDECLPEADIVYLPGGYPELFAAELAANITMKDSIRAFAESGGKILAECGGLIYLSEMIDGNDMCGVFPLKATMKDARLTLGYRSLAFNGISIQGHEFHYSHIENPHAWESIAVQKNARGEEVDTPVYRYKNTIAGYTHLYWGEKDILKIWDQ